MEAEADSNISIFDGPIDLKSEVEIFENWNSEETKEDIIPNTYTENIVKCSECKKELPDDHEIIKNHMKTEHMPQLRKLKMPEVSATNVPTVHYSNQNIEFNAKWIQIWSNIEQFIYR